MKAQNRYNLILNLAASVFILGGFAVFCFTHFNAPSKEFIVEFLVAFVPAAILCSTVSINRLHGAFLDYGFLLLAPFLFWHATQLLTFTGVIASLFFLYVQYKAITKEETLVYSSESVITNAKA
ncbi:hypothetical protein OCF84_21345 (plasmid) [Shewanella xiamenensis]|uniref:Uncharacterized protein n=1 Tax=Shewanella xiamenensis TaxID=332186 RepID=A0ABT6UDN4_9GAMM|nr:hypothetical protein [Shewanella xiamenensis]MDI5832577.1 hypothetical protein [Shewanella xiamenensis]WHF57805.1 hypothetical protein OCF84_21345 [Shewanella xiamenensis]